MRSLIICSRLKRLICLASLTCDNIFIKDKGISTSSIARRINMSSVYGENPSDCLTYTYLLLMILSACIASCCASANLQLSRTMSATDTKLGSVQVNAARFSINWITRQVLAAVFVYSIWPAIMHYSYWFSWHIILCTFGYVPLMAEAVMLFAGDELWSRQLSRQTKYYIHGVLITVGTVTLSVGAFLFTYYADRAKHFHTIHGITGLISMILALISIPIGYGAVYAQKFSKFCKPVWVKGIHNLVGILAYIIGIVSLAYGYYTHWFSYYTSWESRIVATVSLGVFSLWPLNTAFVSGYNQLKTIISSYRS